MSYYQVISALRVDGLADMLAIIVSPAPYHLAVPLHEDHILDATVRLELKANLLTNRISPERAQVAALQKKDLWTITDSLSAQKYEEMVL
jgi:hypothetical protein